MSAGIDSGVEVKGEVGPSIKSASVGASNAARPHTLTIINNIQRQQRDRGKKVMLDCGIHPGFSGLASLPFLDEVDLDTVDVALITHFHLDHCAAVPYLVGKTNFKGRLVMTHPTKAIFYTLLQDFVRVSAPGSADEALYSEADLEAAMARAEVLDFDQSMEVDGIKVRVID